MTSNCLSSRVAWIGPLISKTAEKEGHDNDDREIGTRLKNWIILDNGSTTPLSLFSNPDLVEDTQTTSKTLILATNTGVKHSEKEAVVPGFDEV